MENLSNMQSYSNLNLKYKFENLKIKSDIPVTVFYSESDTPFEIMKYWEKYFTNTDFIKYTGSGWRIDE